METNLLSNELVTDDLMCALCLDNFSRPKILPCGHTFCFACLDQYLSCTENARKQMKCPICQATSKITRRTLEKVPDNYTVKNIISSVENLRKLTESKSETCGFCEEPCDLTNVCKSCSLWLCSTCTKGHRKYPDFSDHVIESREGATEELKKMVAEKMKEMNTRSAYLKAKIFICSTKSDEVKKDCENIKKLVIAETESYIQVINRTKNNLILRVDQFHENQLEILQHLKDVYQSQVATFDIYQKTSNAIDNESVVELYHDLVSKIDGFLSINIADLEKDSSKSFQSKMKWEQCKQSSLSAQKLKLGYLSSGKMY